MKLLFDQNLRIAWCLPWRPCILVRCTSARWGWRWQTMKRSGICEQQGLVIVSKDMDLYHRSVVFGNPPKVVWIRMGNCATARD